MAAHAATAGNGNMEGISYDTPLDDSMSYGPGKASMTGMDSGFMNVLAQEMMRLMKDKQQIDNSPSNGPSSCFANFAGPYN